MEGHILGNLKPIRSGYFPQDVALAHGQAGNDMGDVGSFPGIQQRPVRGVQLQHSAGQFLAGILVHLGEMHHGLGICDVLQVYIGLVYFYGDGFFHSDVARDSFQFSYLVIAVGGFKGKLPIGISFCGGNGIFSGELSDFRIEQTESDAL